MFPRVGRVNRRRIRFHHSLGQVPIWVGRMQRFLSQVSEQDPMPLPANHAWYPFSLDHISPCINPMLWRDTNPVGTTCYRSSAMGSDHSLAYGRSCTKLFIDSNSRVPPGGPKTPYRRRDRACSSHKTRPHTALPEKKPTFKPLSMARCMWRYMSMVQYSSCPTLKKPFALANGLGKRGYQCWRDSSRQTLLTPAKIPKGYSQRKNSSRTEAER